MLYAQLLKIYVYGIAQSSNMSVLLKDFRSRHYARCRLKMVGRQGVPILDD
jgi:hypothetical protein